MPPETTRDPSPAELFERFFGPSIFQPWTSVLLERAEPRPGERVLDLACATAIVARRVAREAADGVEVVGLDISPDMLAVARERASAENVTIAWHEGTRSISTCPRTPSTWCSVSRASSSSTIRRPRCARAGACSSTAAGWR